MAEKVKNALFYATQYGQIDGAHHKAWVIDQIVRALTGCPKDERGGVNGEGEPFTYLAQGESDDYIALIRNYRDGEDGPETYEWDEGIAP